MEQKMIVLKPLVWNTNGYTRPAGIEKLGNDFVGTNGFGGEEWNGNPNRMWNGQRVFHTESKPKLWECGVRGELGIIMTAYNDGVAHALGVATSVRANTRNEQREIARALRHDAEAQGVWQLASVKRRHPDWQRFKKFWARECLSYTWRCPPSEFVWFTNPVPLKPSDLFPPSTPGGKSPAIIKMHGMYQAIRPDQAFAAVGHSLDADSPIIAWLSTGNFDETAIAKKTKAFAKPNVTLSDSTGRSAAAAVCPYVRYMQNFEIQVPDRHNQLHDRFEKYLKSINAESIISNQRRVDIQFGLEGLGRVLAEIKPCDLDSARFAVRCAMGQLLDYRQRHTDKTAVLLVVVEVRPSCEDIDLALSNGFGVAYPDATKFILAWPK